MTEVSTFAVKPSPHPRSLADRAAALEDLHFGSVFTDHMARARWTTAAGWGERRVEAYAPLQLDPATAVFHYAQEVFEGLKAYRHSDGSVWTFRPEANAARLAASARRLALPELSEADFLGSIEALVQTDAEWVPSSPGSSLYLRPFMFASESFIGVRPSGEVEYLVIASPVGPYFSAGFTPVSIWVDRDFHRVGPGGTGAAKCGGNYAASLLPQRIAAENGCEQVCFLDAGTNSRIEELGGMNTFFVTADGAIHTPRLSGTILEGITRSSILQVAEQTGRQVRERDITLTEVLDGLGSGEVTEVFACGTAAVVTPIGRLKSTDFDVAINGGEAGPITSELYETITDIQYGRRPDAFGWMHRLA
ncbi:branched-chain amino acid aminotransferase [Pseudactinotalea sp. HY160]|uniref:branched-chain amino acid aminotransferase n=1 Tax=Pseudactinotalea sp. HY160 TaxID=2654490 RepID=UPI00128B97D8|nr:branched-chain amino acid aminotransferase [Pseudactinotalea sp. HY160]MPV50364.1 branched-chain amino acid aminotransferase [Pseudactinotalea sp. HY160]